VKSIDSLNSLAYKPFRRLFFGATISNIGTWIETVVIGIFMQEQTKDARIVATALAAGYLPQALIGLFSGPLIDRFSRKKIVIACNSSSVVIAGLLAASVELEFATPTLVISLVFLAGFIHAISFPAWQTLINDVVPKEKVAGALTLMFAQWNLGRIIGPAIAALLLAGNHYTIALSLNAFSFIVVIFMVSLLRQKDFQNTTTVNKSEETFRQTFLEGWKYILSPKYGVRKGFIVYILILLWASPFIALIPNVADSVFNNKNLGTSLFTTSQGIGAVLISITMTTFYAKLTATRVQQILLFILPFILIGFGLAPNLLLATPFALLFGIAYVGALTSTPVTAQLAANHEMKGRVAAGFSSTLGLLFTIASILQGFLAQQFGARVLFVSTGIGLAISSILVGAFSKSYSLPKSQEPDGEADFLEAGETVV